MGELELPNGSIKHELIDLTVEDGKAYVNLKTSVSAFNAVRLLLVEMLFFMLQKVQLQNF